ncbi:MAG TPA: tyrosine-type recombinase/integrase [Steroidobacteraceae bacterium]|nr:tyrosine-type recombinase/integrase [Steroidobacteraceae bacterium]
MASIVRHGDGWRAFLWVEGKRETRVFRTRREAKEWADAREAELEAGGSGITFGAAAERWLLQRNDADVEAMVRRHILPALAERKLAEITRLELVALVRGIAENGRIETARRAGQRIRQIFDSAVDHGEISMHPAADLARVLPATAKKPMGAIRADELPDLMRAIDGYTDPITRAGLNLLAYTFVRTQELIRATWPELKDGETWLIPDPRMKARVPHVVPLARQVQAILADLRTLAPDNRHFLPSTVNPMCGLSNNTLLYALYRLGYRGRMTGHGFRSVASSVLNESGLWSRDAIERQLAHKESDHVREAYHRAEYLEERRRMMQWWADYLDASRSSTQE